MNATAQQQELITTEEPARAVVTSETVAIVQMIERAASNPNVDIDKMERLLEMQERVIARNARSAYAAAFADMQQHLPTIAERGTGDKQKTYALWEDINDAIKPVLAKYGFGISFKTGRTTERVTVTAILMHRAGHSEETTLELPVDTSGSKNAVQAVGSSTSYGKRYTAQALLNLTSRDGIEKDDDGKSAVSAPAEREYLSEAQADELEDLIDAVGADREKLFKYLKVTSLLDIFADRFADVKRLIESKRAKS